MKYVSFYWLPVVAVMSVAKLVTLTEFTCSLTNTAILSPKNKDCTKINDQIMNTLIEDDSRTYHSTDSIIYGDKSSEQHYPIEFLNHLSPSGIPADRQNLKINNIVMLNRNLNANEGLANTVLMITKLAQALHSS
jgi:ATP-dependent DNA helicase PIF1